MGKQMAAFPVTEEERIAGIRLKLSKDAEKKRNESEAASEKYQDALEASNEAEALLETFDRMTEALSPSIDGLSVLHAVADRVNAGELDHDGTTVTATVHPASSR